MASSVVEKLYSVEKLYIEYGPAPEDSDEAVRWSDAHKRSFGHLNPTY